MRKTNRLKSTLLMIVMAIAYLFIPTPATLSQTYQRDQGLSWSVIWKWLVGQKSRGSSRGGICLIAPGVVSTNAAVDRTPEVWSDRPLFVWKGTAQRITVRPQGSQDVLWSQTLTAADQNVTYAETVALQPGQTYDGEIIDEVGGKNPFTFKVMGAEQRDRIAADLAALKAQPQDKGATAEKIALQRANYFAQKQLWSDVLQAAFSVKNLSAELNDLIDQTPTQFCNPPASGNLTP